ncbi:MAG: M28 family peptidase [Polyangiales bacterium]
MRPLAASLLLALGLLRCVTPAVAQPRRSPPVAPRCEVPDEETEARLRRDVAWLSDDAREGREPGTAGSDATLRYLTAELVRLGLRPGGTDGFLQPFEVDYGHATDPSAAVVFTRDNTDRALAPSTDFAVVGGPFTAEGAATGPLFFAGHALVTPHGAWNDFRVGPSVRGGILVALSGAPHTTDPARAAILQREHVVGSLAGKARAAQQRGAVALIIIELSDGAVGPRYTPAPEHGIPVVHITRAQGRWLLGRDPVAMDAESGVTALAGTTARVTAATRPRRVRTANVIALAGGTDPAATERDGLLLLGAHQDHIGHGARTSRMPGSTDVHNGADDNASGTAAVLELARRVAHRRARHTVAFAWFGAEELGLLGSQHLAAHPTPALTQLAAMWNFDMVGRLRGCRLYLDRTGASRRFARTLSQANAPWGLDARPWDPRQGSWGASDHMSFTPQGVPTLFFFTGLHGEYHGPLDDAPTLNYRGEAAGAGGGAGASAGR